MATDSDPALDPEEMRRLGHLVVDRLVDWSRALDDGPAGVRGSRSDLLTRLDNPPTEEPSEPAALIDELESGGSRWIRATG